jgi:hypothetical protein
VLDLLVRSVIEVVHFHVELDLVVDVVVELLLVMRHEAEVIEGLEAIDLLGSWLLFGIIID